MKVLAPILVLFIIFSGCAGEQATEWQPVPRESMIPADAVKVLPEDDNYPSQMHSDGWGQPVPLAGPVNTAGAEDSPFMTTDDRFFFFFTPDVRVPVEKQILDNVTGMYYSKKKGDLWSRPERVYLTEPGKLSLDGCQYVHGNEMLFCSAREGYTGVNLFTATFKDGNWTDWQPVDEILKTYEVGEMHIHGDELYFHSPRAGGKGGYDIWMTRNVDGEWQEPVNIDIVNSEDTDGWPYITEDGNELWFTRTYMGSPGIFRSVKEGGEWSEPELVISQFAGEPTLDSEGNIYFVHHFYRDGEMIEADIYVAYKK